MIIPLHYDPAGHESAAVLLDLLKKNPTLFLYVGPDQLMPLTSVLGALVGIALMFWNKIVGIAVKVMGLFGRREQGQGQ